MTTEIIHSVTLRKEGGPLEEHTCLVNTQDHEDALESALKEAEGYTRDDCEVLRVVLEPGAALPIGFFWKKVIWLDDCGPTVAPK